MKQHLGRQAGVQNVEVSLRDGKVDVTPKEDGRIDPAQLLKATYDSGVSVAELDMTARGKIVKDASGNLALQVEPNQSFTLTSNELSKALEPLANSATQVTVRGQLYKKPDGKGKKKADISAPLKFLVVVVAGGLAGCNRNPVSPAQHRAAIAAGEVGSHLPDFALKDLQGNEVSSSDLRGKVVLIDIWATWCQPCKKEMPGYQKLLDRYGSRGFAVVGRKSNIMMDTGDPIQFAKEIGVHYPLAVASADVLQKFGGIEGLSTTMIYDRKGILRKK